MNYRAVIDGAVTAPDNYKYRKCNDARIPFGISALQRSGRGISLPNEAFTYGRANRPQTPIDGIISNNFGEGASDSLQARYANLKVFKKVNSPKCNGIEIRYTNAKTRAEEFIKSKNSFDLSMPTEFKLKRFQNVDAKVDHKRP